MTNWLRKAAREYSEIWKNLGIALAALAVAVLATVAALWVREQQTKPDNVTPTEQRFGWAGPERAEIDWEALKGEFSEFAIKGQTESTAGKRVVLWDYAKAVNGGKHIPTLRQQVGSCVGHGGANAVMYLMATQIAIKGKNERWVLVYEPACYGFSREELGFQLSGDGSTGSAMAAAVKKHGILFATAEGLPEWSTTEGRLGTTISFPGSIDRKWGKRPGVPEPYRGMAKKHLVKTVAKLTSYEQIRDAICNGYPVTIACGQGFDRMETKDGKLWGVPVGRWPHQQCFIGVDDNPTRPGVCCLNSWGAEAHGECPDGAPPGSYWVDAKIVDRMAKDEAFALSNFDGFPEQDLDWNVIKAHLGHPNEPANPEDN